MRRQLVTSYLTQIEVVRDAPAPPLARQVYLRVRKMIEEGRLRPGAQLPSTRSLSSALGVSRGTVIAAFDDLIADRLVTTIAGSGTFVERSALRRRSSRSLPRNGGRSGTLSNRDSLTLSTPLGAAMQSRFGQSFEIDLPAIDAFPFRLWERLALRVCRRGLHHLYRHTDPAGYAPLREAIVQHLGEMRGVCCDPEQVLIVTGTLQAVDLICRVLLDDRHTVWLEEPGRVCLRTIPRLSGANIAYAPVDEHGMQVQPLEAGTAARMAIVTPSAHFPLGVTMSLARRLALLRWAQARDTWIVEDDTGVELTEAGLSLPSLWSLDTSGRVIYTSTFRSTTLPSFRLGFVVLPPDLVDSFVRMRFLVDGFRPALDQAMMAEFVHDGYYTAHVRQMRHIYQERQTLLTAMIAERLGDALVPALPTAIGNLQTLFRIAKPWHSAAAVSRDAADQGIIVPSIARYHAMKPASDDLVILGHAASTPAARDVEKLARALGMSIEGLLQSAGR